MKTTEEIFNILMDKFGDSILEMKTGVPVESYIIVDPLKVDDVSIFLRDDTELRFDNCMNLSGVDDANGKKEVQPDGNSVIVGGTLSVVYHLESVYLKHKLTLKVSTPRENPQVKSVANIWHSADWNEREAYDLFGINFINHPDLRRILMPYDWEAGYPLRKDYKNPEYYQGMKVPY